MMILALLGVAAVAWLIVELWQTRRWMIEMRERAGEHRIEQERRRWRELRRGRQ